MQPGNSRSFRASFNASSQECRKALDEEECRKALIEYYELARLPDLSEVQFGRMQHILQMADGNDAMSLLINEIDEVTFQELGFYDESRQSHFKNEVSRTQEFVLGETEYRLLVPSALEAQVNFINARSASTNYPRVERVFEPNCGVQLELRRKFFCGDVDDLVICPHCGCLHLRQNNLGKCKCRSWYSGRLIYNWLTEYRWLIEESVSLFTIFGLAFLIFLLLI